MGEKDERATPAAPAEENEESLAPAESDFAALFAASETTERTQPIAEGDLVRGRVIAVGQTTAFIAIGAKGEAVIDLTEFRDADTGEIHLAVGDELEATVVDDGKRYGSIILKRTLGRGGHVPAELQQAYAHRLPVEGLVSAEVKGGFEIQIGGIRAFCPGSQIDYRRGATRVPAEEYIGQRLQFRVTRLEGSGRNVVVSRRELLEEDAATQAAATWERLQVGAVVQGTVTSIRDFGAFVDLGGVEGLIHVSELGHARVKHPSEAVTVGQVIEAQVVKIDPAVAETPRARRQIGLSLKALAPDPWATARERFPVGLTVPGTVQRLENFGAFVQIAPGIDGLVHVSKLVLDRRISHPRQAVSPGDVVDVTVLAVDTAKRRIGLSMVEHARQVRDEVEGRERAEAQAAVTQTNERKSLGTFADLLAAPKKTSQG